MESEVPGALRPSFSPYGDCGAQSIQSEHRVRARHQSHVLNGNFRNQIPRHNVAKGLVLAHAIHVNRHSLRSSQQGRSGVAAVIQIRLKRIFLIVVHVNAVQVAVHEVRKVDCAAVLNIFGVGGLNVHRHIGFRHHAVPAAARPRSHRPSSLCEPSASVTVCETGVAERTSTRTVWVAKPLFEIRIW